MTVKVVSGDRVFAKAFLAFSTFWSQALRQAAASLKESDVWKNIPAVKAGHVLDVDYNIFYFADPMSLDLQLDAFKEAV